MKNFIEKISREFIITVITVIAWVWAFINFMMLPTVFETHNIIEGSVVGNVLRVNSTLWFIVTSLWIIYLLTNGKRLFGKSEVK